MDRDPDSVIQGYSAAQIKKTTWGEIAEIAPGVWKTVWELAMDTSRIDAGPLLIHSDDGLGFIAQLYPADTGRVRLTVYATGHAMRAEYYPLTFTTFRLVNDDVGEIETIEGLPRDWYSPFRTRLR
jgi:hypothetical protein